MQFILSKLPVMFRHKWRAVACDLHENLNEPATFKDIMDFVEKQVKIATDLVGGRSLIHSKTKGSSFASTTGMEDIRKTNKGLSCLCCGEEHFLNSYCAY